MGDDQLNIKYSSVYNASVDKGSVIKQSIAAGTVYTQGDEREVTLVISKGPKLEKVPNVLGKTKEKAIDLIHKNNLKYEVIGYRYSNAYGDGKVMKQKLRAGKKVKKNTVVKIVVSKGRKPVPTPKPVSEPEPEPRQAAAPTKAPAASKPKATKQPNPLGDDSSQPNPLG